MEPGLPNFFVIGAPKAGTTFLWHLLKQHPQVFMPEIKEPWFLSHDDRFEQLGWDWYRSLFAGATGSVAIGEASSCYCMTRLYPRVLPRLSRFFSNARIIFCVREPHARIESAWKQCLGTRHPMPRRFSEAVREYPPLLEGSRYGETLTRYLEIFPRDRIHILLFENLGNDLVAQYRHCLDFLGVDSHFLPDLESPRNRSADKRVDTPLYRLLRQTSVGKLGAQLPSRRLRKFLSHCLRRRLPQPRWNPELRAWVQYRLGDDTERFIQLAGFGENPWSRTCMAVDEPNVDPHKVTPSERQAE